MLLASDQNHNLVVRTADNSAATFAAANSNAGPELVEPGRIVSFAGRNETMALMAAVKQSLQSDGTTRVEVLEMSLSFVDFVGFGLLLVPLTWCPLIVESFGTQL